MVRRPYRKEALYLPERHRPHNLASFIVDSTDWNGWHYPGFFEEGIAGFHKNSWTPSECNQITTLADCLWNVKGYDKDRSIHRGVNQLLGAGMYETLLPGMKALSYFDSPQWRSRLQRGVRL